MKHLPKLILAVLALTAAGCDQDTRGTVTPYNQPISEADYHVKFLFEIDGVKVYKFYDGRSVYFTVPSGETYYEQSRCVNKNHHTTDRVECINVSPECWCGKEGAE